MDPTRSWTRLLTLCCSASALSLPSACAPVQTSAPTEQNLLEDLTNVPIPRDAFKDPEDADLAAIVLAEHGLTFPKLRVMAFGVPEPCSAIESFYRGYWKQLTLVERPSRVDDRRTFFAVLEWRGKMLVYRPIATIEEAEKTVRHGVFLIFTEVPANPIDQFLRRDDAEKRKAIGIPPGTTWCSMRVLNSRGAER